MRRAGCSPAPRHRAAQPRCAAPRGDAAELPIILRAQTISGRPDLEAMAEGDAEFRRGGIVIRADRLSYEQADDLAHGTRQRAHQPRRQRLQRPRAAAAACSASRASSSSPSYDSCSIGAGGTAERIDFLDSSARERHQRAPTPAARATAPATRPGCSTTDRVSSTSRPTKASPRARCCASSACRSWRAGAELPAHRRAQVGLAAAEREPRQQERLRGGGAVLLEHRAEPRRDVHAARAHTPRARPATASSATSSRATTAAQPGPAAQRPRWPDRSRYALHWSHEGALADGLRYDVARGCASPTTTTGRTSPTPAAASRRACWSAGLACERPFDAAGGEGLVYARVQRWQVLQGSRHDLHRRRPTSARRRSALRFGSVAALRGGFEVSVRDRVQPLHQPDGSSDACRPHAPHRRALARAGSASAGPWRGPGWSVTPRLSFNAAAYRTRPGHEPTAAPTRVARHPDAEPGQPAGCSSARPSWLRPHAAPDAGAAPAVRQHAVPRPERPAELRLRRPRTSTSTSIYTENTFSGIDRVSDAHQLTAGVTTRLLDADTGAEALRLGMVQRYLLRDQRVTPDWTARRRLAAAALLRRAAARLDHAACRTGRWTARCSTAPTAQRSVRSICRRALLAGAVPHAQRDLPLCTRELSEQVEAGLAVADLTSAASPAAQAAAAVACRNAARSAAAAAWYSAWAASTTACRTAASPIRSSASSTTPAAGSAASWPSGCPPAAARRPRGCCCSSSWSACRGSAPTRCRS